MTFVTRQGNPIPLDALGDLVAEAEASTGCGALHPRLTRHARRHGDALVEGSAARSPHRVHPRLDIVRGQPRHLRLNYVFREYLEGGQAMPLFGLAESVSGVAMGRSFAELQALYDRMVWVDSAAEAQAFMGDVQSMQ